jgi:translation initiation factor 5A
MADAAEPDVEFETAESGSSLTYPLQAGELRKGSHVMIKGHPCKVAEITTSKTGKHGHAKAHIVAIDIFTSKKYEDLCPCSHNIEVPFVKRTEFQALTVDGDSGEVSLLLDSGETKDDLNLPDRQKIGEPTDEDKKLSKDLTEAVEKGEKTVIVAVLEACAQEKIVGYKEADN